MMDNSIGKREIVSQERVINLFKQKLNYDYLGNWQYEIREKPIEQNILKDFLAKQGYSDVLIKKAIDKLLNIATNLSDGLLRANQEVYSLLRYGVSVRENIGENNENVFLIDWKNPLNNQFAIAEEVSFKGGKHTKRPDIVVYVNGIALGVLELKRSNIIIEDGIRQNLDNQKADFIQKFFTTIQLVCAGNDFQGINYGTIETPAKRYLSWKEETQETFDYPLDKHITQLFSKERFLELIHDFVIYDNGIKKLCRPNQYFGIKSAQERIKKGEGGILWHSQGSGKSLIMVLLAKWVRENITDSRILIITDRTELDGQIETLFGNVNEKIYRTKNGKNLLDVLNKKEESFICSLVHKFGRASENGDYDSYIEELRKNIGSDFLAKGNIFVFVDECHRTQSGKLHDAMKQILPNAVFIGFTGTPLLKKDKKKSIEIFGSYIGNPYRFDEAVEDKVVLDLLYEARDVEQFITDKQSIDEWFDAETQGLTDTAQSELKAYWGRMQKVLSSKSRLEKIVFDILKDFRTKPRLKTGQGNAMLVSSSVYEACKYYELFQQGGFKECAIVTSYKPHHSKIKGEETGESGSPTQQLLKYEVYNKMLNGKTVEEFEEIVKKSFIKEPNKMKLLIVVDKLLTGFDAPSATYLYIDKKMQDHGLFQAICRVNRVDDDTKDYGYIIDYKDLFKSLEKSITDYTSNAFDDYDNEDVKGLLKNRYSENKENFELALEGARKSIESIIPKDEISFVRYFCGDPEKITEIEERSSKRQLFYKIVNNLIRAYGNIANDIHKLYSPQEATDIKEEVTFFKDLKDTIKVNGRDYIDLKLYEAGMQQLIDMYLEAKPSQKISDFESQTLVDLIVNLNKEVEDAPPSDKAKKRELIADTVANNVRKVIIEQNQSNPKYFEKMSNLLTELVQQKRQEKIDYQEYLEKIKELAQQISSSTNNNYPISLDTKAKQSLFDNLDKNEELALELNQAIHNHKLDNWRGNDIKEKKLMMAIFEVLKDKDKTIELMELIKAQDEY